MKTTSSQVRPPAVAGRFYPDGAIPLRASVERYLGEARRTNIEPKAIIAPHAGYVYSGPVAGTAFAHWMEMPGADQVRRIVVMGPSHQMAFEGVALTGATAFQTPLGQVPVDVEACGQLAELPGVKHLEEAHNLEHCLEVELPFLQCIFRDFSLVPLVVGNASDKQVADILERIWGGPETRFVISSDLSHYLDYETANALDRATSRSIEKLEPQAIREHQACGRIPIRGLLLASQRLGLKAHQVDLRNSGDTAGSKDRVVGYGAFVFGDE
jgi:AmmeMemoRadiSam system protein B